MPPIATIPWNLRLRLPKSVEVHEILTVTDNEQEARELAQRHVEELNSPSIRIISIERRTKNTTEKHADLLKRWGPGGTERDDEGAEPKKKTGAPTGRVGT